MVFLLETKTAVLSQYKASLVRVQTKSRECAKGKVKNNVKAVQGQGQKQKKSSNLQATKSVELQQMKKYVEKETTNHNFNFTEVISDNSCCSKVLAAKYKVLCEMRTIILLL